MRKILIAALFIIPFIGNGQLSELSQRQKQNNPEVYENIKEAAQKKWGDDYEMTVYEINKQMDSMASMCMKINGFLSHEEDAWDRKIFFKSFQKWGYEWAVKYNTELLEKISSHLKNNDVDNTSSDFMKLKVDWEMLDYEYNKQLTAKNNL